MVNVFVLINLLVVIVITRIIAAFVVTVLKIMLTVVMINVEKIELLHEKKGLLVYIICSS